MSARDRWSTGESHRTHIEELERAIQEARRRLANKPSIVVEAEFEAYEHNLRADQARLRVVTQQSEEAWRKSLPAARAAISLIPAR